MVNRIEDRAWFDPSRYANAWEETEVLRLLDAARPGARFSYWNMLEAV